MCDIKGAAPVRATIIFYVFGDLPKQMHYKMAGKASLSMVRTIFTLYESLQAADRQLYLTVYELKLILLHSRYELLCCVRFAGKSGHTPADSAKKTTACISCRFIASALCISHGQMRPLGPLVAPRVIFVAPGV